MPNSIERSTPVDRLRILIVDDDERFLEEMSLLMKHDCDIRVAKTGVQALEEFGKFSFDTILLDIGLGSRSMSGLHVLEKIHEEDPHVPVIMVTGDSTLQSVRDAFKNGAVDYIDKKLDKKELNRRIMRALHERNRLWTNESLKRSVSRYVGDMIGDSEKMRELRENIRLAAQHDLPILIVGETGTGKEVVANEIHRLHSPDAPYESLNCALPPAGSFERELFGCEKGAFTDVDRMVGRFESAGDGVILLDEITEINSAVQAKLLRIIQEREFQRLGGVRRIRFRAKLLATTNRDLEESLAQGGLRADLFYRFSIPAIRVPPLRERRSDVPALVQYFLDRKPGELGKQRREMSAELVDELGTYDWPGNVRQLEKVIEAFIISDGNCALPGRHGGGGGLTDGLEDALQMDYRSAKRATMRAFQKKYIQMTLDSCNGDLTEAARKMKISRYGLQKILDQLES